VAALSLAWPCQHQDGVSTTSPGAMSTRAPSTTVYVPGLASTTSRKAAAVWRCERAFSPPFTI